MTRLTDASLADELRALGWLVPGDVRTCDLVLAMVRGVVIKPGNYLPARRPVAADQQSDRADLLPKAVLPVPTSSDCHEPATKTKPPVSPPVARPRAAKLHGTLADTTTVTRTSSAVVRAAPVALTSGVSPTQASSQQCGPRPAAILALRHARAVLSLLAATIGESNEPDVLVLIECVAQGRPISRLPRRPALTTRRGVQLLIDCGSAMSPLSADREQVRVGMVRLLGSERVETLYFAGCPTLGAGPGLRPSWTAWTSPAVGTPVVVVSDVGMVGSTLGHDWAGTSEWRAFAELACNRANQVLVLSPFNRERWPAELARRFVWVPWSERLSAAELNRIRRDAHSRG